MSAADVARHESPPEVAARDALTGVGRRRRNVVLGNRTVTTRVNIVVVVVVVVAQHT